MQNAITWFELPASNFERAVAFYSEILGQPIHTGDFGGVAHGFFPKDEEAIGGAIIASPTLPGAVAKPGDSGPVIYINASNQIEAIFSRIEAAGGKVVAPITAIGPFGYTALFIDTEGNQVGLHAQQR